MKTRRDMLAAAVAARTPARKQKHDDQWAYDLATKTLYRCRWFNAEHFEFLLAEIRRDEPSGAELQTMEMLRDAAVRWMRHHRQPQTRTYRAMAAVYKWAAGRALFLECTLPYSELPSEMVLSVSRTRGLQ